MARCEICDYCDSIGSSSFTDTSGYGAGSGKDLPSAEKAKWEKLLSGDYESEASFVVDNLVVWEDERGELCSYCRRMIDATNKELEYMENERENSLQKKAKGVQLIEKGAMNTSDLPKAAEIEEH